MITTSTLYKQILSDTIEEVQVPVERNSVFCTYDKTPNLVQKQSG